MFIILTITHSINKCHYVLTQYLMVVSAFQDCEAAAAGTGCGRFHELPDLKIVFG